ncbi:MAG: MFS transporter [Endomicrobium sp.]|jgi:sugar phosphate permease|nr:MFS transporter [Endomicrobium sp.]
MKIFKRFLNWMKPLPTKEVSYENDEHLRKKYKFWRVRMFCGMYLAYVIYYFARTNINYATPSMMEAYNITASKFGYITMALFITYGIGKFVSGMLADKCNIRAFMSFGLLGSAIINLVFGFIPSVSLLALLWGVNGIFQSMGYPPAAKGLVYWFSPTERATKWSLWSTSHTIGASLIGFLVAYSIKFGSWQAAFYLPGILGLFTVIILLITLTDKPSAVGLPPIDIYRNDPPVIKQESNVSHFEILKKYVFCNFYIWILSITYIFIYFIRWFPLNWGTLFMSQRGIANHTAAFLLTSMPLIGSFGGLLSGWFADKCFKGRCAPVIIIYLIGLMVGLWGMYKYTYATTSPFIISLFFALVGFCVAGPQAIIGGLYVSRVTAQESISAACGFTGMFGYFGAILTGLIGRIIDKHGWNGIFLTCYACCILSMIFIAFTWKREKQGLMNKQQQGL